MPDPEMFPHTPEEIEAAAAARGLVIPQECRQGVAENLALLESHVRRMRGEEGVAA